MVPKSSRDPTREKINAHSQTDGQRQTNEIDMQRPGN